MESAAEPASGTPEDAEQVRLRKLQAVLQHYSPQQAWSTFVRGTHLAPPRGMNKVA